MLSNKQLTTSDVAVDNDVDEDSDGDGYEYAGWGALIVRIGRRE